ncbi:uncharacterized protein GGS22DRAFT_161491 [Annulohypoxylon maeteangense]|uniref:uncharacterized protein n=1 Tax=Annulohypoxylon maeteangense TaxID=1927788 RepID=UPI002007D4AA|nr:uncharacterized protein GGS22DRAFT_161491 [Annulohypoxylon maeteangense]KAI0885643.1 hypothetical protein GGS22DRAFT_161491 [Annulohypoxylon maeteangense]
MKQLNVSILLMLGHLLRFSAAGFQNEFNDITRGSDLLLKWDPINSTDYPLVVHSRLINQTSQYGANSLEVNITIGLNASSFMWKNIPYPLPYLETAKYEVEVWPRDWGQSKASVSAFASSSYFTVSQSEEAEITDSLGSPFNETIIIPSKPTTQPTSKGGINNNTAIAAGLVVPIVVLLAIFGFVLTQQRQKRILEEKRKQREDLYID